MSDKPFNEQPLIVVVSNALDPRIKRQLDAQLQATTMSLGEVETELENMEAMKVIASQKESSSDQSEFDEHADKKPDPAPVEEQAEEQPEDNPDDNQDDEDKKPEDAPDDEQKDENKDDSEDDPFDTKGKDGDSGESEQKSEEGSEGSGGEAGGEGDDPFGVKGDDSTGNVNFEAFGGLTGFKIPKPMRMESAAEAPKLPPIKNLVVITGTNTGVDSRTASVVATLEDPANTVVVIDVSAVTDITPKMEFSSLTSQLQARGILVVPTLDAAVDFLNEVYDEVSQ